MTINNKKNYKFTSSDLRICITAPSTDKATTAPVLLQVTIGGEYDVCDMYLSSTEASNGVGGGASSKQTIVWFAFCYWLITTSLCI